jgi:hypothetical protein
MCGPKLLPIKVVASLLAAWLKQVGASNAIISDLLLRIKALCITRMFALQPLMAVLIVSSSDTLLCTKNIRRMQKY